MPAWLTHLFTRVGAFTPQQREVEKLREEIVRMQAAEASRGLVYFNHVDSTWIAIPRTELSGLKAQAAFGVVEFFHGLQLWQARETVLRRFLTPIYLVKKFNA